ncbi:hypothetical protein ANO14919_103530 [Xylariales sp. No.14919]|nr:hypothetical protein ANO14919_103530 [Xylariales sp. No.14919]
MLTSDSVPLTGPYALTTLPVTGDNFFTGIGIPFENSSNEVSVDLGAMSPWAPTSPIVVQNGSQETQPSPCSDALSNMTHQQDKDTLAPPTLSLIAFECQSHPQQTSTSTSGHVCLDTALQTLRELHCSPSEDTISSEQALKINRVALQRMSHILSHNCNTCIADSNIGLLLYTISSRMLTRYQTIFDCISQRDVQSQEHRHTLSNRVLLPCENLRFQPVQFGDFNIDLPAARFMNSQLLLFELKNMEKFLATFANYIEKRELRGACCNRATGTQGEPKPRPSISPILEAFHSFLGQSIAYLCTEIRTFFQGQNE